MRDRIWKYGEKRSNNSSSNFEFRLQRFVEENILSKYKEKIGKIVSGVVSRVDKNESTFIEIGEIKGVLLRKIELKVKNLKLEIL